jgi:hypothetical protein
VRVCHDIIHQLVTFVLHFHIGFMSYIIYAFRLKPCMCSIFAAYLAPIPLNFVYLICAIYFSITLSPFVGDRSPFAYVSMSSDRLDELPL